MTTRTHLVDAYGDLAPAETFVDDDGNELDAYGDAVPVELFVEECDTDRPCSTCGSREEGCVCAVYDDGSFHASLCPLHADVDPCLTMSLVTGTRRKGTIRRGVCTNCGHRS